MTLDEKKVRTVCIVLMALLIEHSLWNLLKYYQTKLSMASPLIPDHIIGQFTQPYLIHAAFTGLAAILGLTFIFRARYTFAIVICIVAVIAEPFLHLYFKSSK